MTSEEIKTTEPEDKTSTDKVLDTYGVLKGRMGESLVRIIFENANLTVFPYGVEVCMPEIALFIKKYIQNTSQQGKAIQHIRNNPDFIVHGDKFGSFFIEVKYRTKGTFEKALLQRYEPDNVKFVLITKDGLFCTSKEEIKDLPSSIDAKKHCKPLSEYEAFGFTDEQKEMVALYDYYARAIFDLPDNTEMHKSLLDCNEKETDG